MEAASLWGLQVLEVGLAEGVGHLHQAEIIEKYTYCIRFVPLEVYVTGPSI